MHTIAAPQCMHLQLDQCTFASCLILTSPYFLRETYWPKGQVEKREARKGMDKGQIESRETYDMEGKCRAKEGELAVCNSASYSDHNAYNCSSTMHALAAWPMHICIMLDSNFPLFLEGNILTKGTGRKERSKEGYGQGTDRKQRDIRYGREMQS